ncbi:MAG: sugar transferase [Actinomycetota bacterium]
MDLPQDLDRVGRDRPLNVGTAIGRALVALVGEPGRPGWISEAMKRGLDMVVAAIGIVALSPLMLVIAAAVRLGSPGPALFHQVRVGRHHSPFVMLKFRTMYRDTDDAAHRAYVTKLLATGEAPHGGQAGIYKLVRDPRITPVGAFLRRTSLDELPQLFNVLVGQMSLVGPRPVLPWEVDLLRPEHLIRFSVKPGITGLWQVSGRSSLPMSQALELDTEYVRRRTLGGDLFIVAKTIPAVLTGRGAA